MIGCGRDIDIVRYPSFLLVVYLMNSMAIGLNVSGGNAVVKGGQGYGIITSRPN